MLARYALGALFAVLGWALMMRPISARAETVTVLSGPDQGEVRVLTPWGDYVAYDEGGGTYWVGTQREYDRQRAIGIARQDNYRLSTVNIDGATAAFVQAGTLRAHVGAIAIDGLSPTIAFGDKITDNVGRAVASMRDVDVSWIQAVGVVPSIVLYSSGDKTVYRTSPPVATGNGWYIATFAVLKKDLVRPIAIIFVVKGAPPTVIGIQSITGIDYKVATLSADSDANLGVQETAEEINHIKYLRIIDPSLANRSAIVKTPSTPSPVASARVASNVTQTDLPSVRDFSGSIEDTVAGRGRMDMRLYRWYGGIRGSWSATFSDATRSNHGDIMGYSERSGGALFYLISASCPYHVVAKLDPSGNISARYTGVECRNGGTFEVHPVKQDTGDAAGTPR